MFCANCAAALPDAARFCTACAAPVVPAGQRAPGSVPLPPPPVPYAHIPDGPVVPVVHREFVGGGPMAGPYGHTVDARPRPTPVGLAALIFVGLCVLLGMVRLEGASRFLGLSSGYEDGVSIAGNASYLLVAGGFGLMTAAISWLVVRKVLRDPADSVLRLTLVAALALPVIWTMAALSGLDIDSPLTGLPTVLFLAVLETVVVRSGATSAMKGAMAAAAFFLVVIAMVNSAGIGWRSGSGISEMSWYLWRIELVSNGWNIRVNWLERLLLLNVATAAACSAVWAGSPSRRQL